MINEQEEIGVELIEKEASIRISELFMNVVRTNDNRRLINKPDSTQIQESTIMSTIVYGVNHDEIIFRQLQSDNNSFTTPIEVTLEDKKVVVNISRELIDGMSRWNRGIGNPENNTFDYSRDKPMFDEVAGRLDYEYRKI